MQFEFRETRLLSAEETAAYIAEGRSPAMDLATEVAAVLAVEGRAVDATWDAQRASLTAELELARAATDDVPDGDNLALARAGQRILALQGQLTALNRTEPQANVDARAITGALSLLLPLRGLGVYDAPFTVTVTDDDAGITVGIARGAGPQQSVAVLSGGEVNPPAAGDVTLVPPMGDLSVTPAAPDLTNGEPQ